MPSTSDTFALNNGLEIPFVGLGTYQMTPEELKTAIPSAIDCGYRLFDTATIYRNEEAVGSCLRDAMKTAGLCRSQVFVTSKLAPADQGYERTLQAVDLSLQKLQMEYIDLYLIHWPGTAKLDPADPQNALNRRESWRALEACVRGGKIKSIGVSNYLVRHLQEMDEYAEIPPAVNQFELHPAYHLVDLVQFCKLRGIFVQSYASLGEGVLLQKEFLGRNQEFSDISAKLNCSLAQLLLKWPLQHGWGIIPKSINPQRIRENTALDSFEINGADMEFLDKFHETEGFKKCWNPESIK